MGITITEALAELKTIGKRLEKKKEFVATYAMRQEKLKDPLEKDGGSVETLKREMQAIGDLHERVVSIRAAIANANAQNTITMDGTTRSIADWLVWRREVAPPVQQFLGKIITGIAGVRSDALRKGFQFRRADEIAEPNDVVVNLDEKALAEQAEALEKLLGDLDGQLSLKNATVTVEIK